MKEIDWRPLFEEMALSAGKVLKEEGASALACLGNRLDDIAKLASETHNDYVQGYITAEQYDELKGDIDFLVEGAKRVCRKWGEAVVQKALNAAVDTLWKALETAIKAV